VVDCPSFVVGVMALKDVGPTKYGVTAVVYSRPARLNNKLGYTPENVVSCCETCNERKRAADLREFLLWARRVALNTSDVFNDPPKTGHVERPDANDRAADLARVQVAMAGSAGTAVPDGHKNV
jgi:hypothetical protein